jgi:hypothetical protein
MPKRERLSGTASGYHFIHRDENGRIEDEVSVGKSLAQDRKRKAKTVVKSGFGDKGDQKARAKKTTAKKAASKKRAPAKKK